MARKELQVYQYLVVTRTARVNLLAHVAQLARQHQLDLRVDILHAVFYHELATLAYSVDVLQFCQKQGQLVLADQPDTFEHGDMSHRAQHIVWSQIEIHLTVSTYGEPLYLGIHLEILFPEFICHYT